MSDMPGMGGSDTMTLLRGSAELPDAGAWWVHLSLSDPSGQVLTSSTELVAVDGGPNPLYLFITGSLIAGAIAIGFIGRRQAAAHAR